MATYLHLNILTRIPSTTVSQAMCFQGLLLSTGTVPTHTHTQHQTFPTQTTYLCLAYYQFYEGQVNVVANPFSLPT